MMCGDVMKSAVKCIAPEATIEAAAAMMRDEGIGFLPVCDRERRVLGTLTDRDIVVRVVAAHASPAQAVQEFMTRTLVSCHPRDELDRASELMSEEKVSRIICLDDDGKLEGVISLSDIAALDDGRRASAALRDMSDRETRA
jgi:CBS domain-containing protein